MRRAFIRIYGQPPHPSGERLGVRRGGPRGPTVEQPHSS
jgi:hypothetical protein